MRSDALRLDIAQLTVAKIMTSWIKVKLQLMTLWWKTFHLQRQLVVEKCNFYFVAC